MSARNEAPMGAKRRSTFTTYEDGVVTRWKVDAVGNRLDSQLMWCLTHDEPVWVYGDRSFQCPYDLIVEASSEHELALPPWDAQ